MTVSFIVTTVGISNPAKLFTVQYSECCIGDCNKSKFDSGGNQEEIEFW
jgi:hypothetical protein